jgi:hypothetical protein
MPIYNYGGDDRRWQEAALDLAITPAVRVLAQV